MTPGRPASLPAVLAMVERFRTPEAEAALDGFPVRATDVFISTYPKSGTTWMQHLVHQLRSAGSMDFEEISVVVPWLESAVDMGIDPTAEQPWTPRAFKSHRMWSELPRGGRYITVFRRPEDVLRSFYRFVDGWWFEAGSVPIDEFAHGLYLAGSASGRHWDHLIDWYHQLTNPDVLVLSYEDMVAVPDRVPGVVAEFLQLDVDQRTLERARLHTDRDFMAAHGHRFDDHVLRRHRDPALGLPPGGDSAKVTPGGRPIEFGPSVRAALAEAWAETVERALGFATYEALRASLPNPLGAPR